MSAVALFTAMGVLETRIPAVFNESAICPGNTANRAGAIEERVPFSEHAEISILSYPAPL